MFSRGGNRHQLAMALVERAARPLGSAVSTLGRHEEQQQERAETVWVEPHHSSPQVLSVREQKAAPAAHEQAWGRGQS